MHFVIRLSSLKFAAVRIDQVALPQNESQIDDSKALTCDLVTFVIKGTDHRANSILSFGVVDLPVAFLDTSPIFHVTATTTAKNERKCLQLSLDSSRLSTAAHHWLFHGL